MFDNSYSEYKRILQRLKDTKRLCSFEEAKKRDSFIVLRHDIDFSITRAYKMAFIERRMGVEAVYYVQTGNRAYNPFSAENMVLLRNIAMNGHQIGLHYRQEENDFPSEIKRQAEYLSDALGIAVTSFSTHRPKKDSEYEKYHVPGLINAYDKRFFTKTDNPEEAEVKYITDSKFRWNYGYPSEELLATHDRVQVLVHPFQWSEEPSTMAECFDSIYREKMGDLIQTFRNEYERFKEVEHGRKVLDLRSL